MLQIMADLTNAYGETMKVEQKSSSKAGLKSFTEILVKFMENIQHFEICTQLCGVGDPLEL